MSREDKMQLDEGGAGRVAGRVFAFVGVTLACAVIAVLAAVFIITKGPSPAAREVFVQRASDSGLSFLAGLFVPEDEIEAILAPEETPVQSEEPVESAAPAESDAPAESAEPVESDAPAESEEPAGSEARSNDRSGFWKGSLSPFVDFLRSVLPHVGEFWKSGRPAIARWTATYRHDPLRRGWSHAHRLRHAIRRTSGHSSLGARPHVRQPHPETGPRQAFHKDRKQVENLLIFPKLGNLRNVSFRINACFFKPGFSPKAGYIRKTKSPGKDSSFWHDATMWGPF